MLRVDQHDSSLARQRCLPGFLFDDRSCMSEDLVDDVDPETVEAVGEPTSAIATEPVEGTTEPIVVTVEERAHGWRVDHYLTRLYSNFSRVAFQRVIGEGLVSINGEKTKMSRRVYPGDTVQFQLPTAPDATLPAEDIPIDVLYEDDAIIVINKAAGMIVHPGKGNYRGTLAGALQFHFDKLSDVAGKLRAGIVHRLDRDTTGVLVVAKDNAVHGNLSSQFEARTVEKEYRAIAWGAPFFDVLRCPRTLPRVLVRAAVPSDGTDPPTASPPAPPATSDRGRPTVRGSQQPQTLRSR